MQILLNGSNEIHTIWGIYPEDLGLNEGEVFAETLSDIQEAFEGKLVYRFPDGKRYALIQLPEGLLSLTAEDLALADFRAAITAEIFQ